MNEVKTSYNQDTGQWLDNKTSLEEWGFHSKQYQDLNVKINNLEIEINC